MQDAQKWSSIRWRGNQVDRLVPFQPLLEPCLIPLLTPIISRSLWHDGVLRIDRFDFRGQLLETRLDWDAAGDFLQGSDDEAGCRVEERAVCGRPHGRNDVVDERQTDRV